MSIIKLNAIDSTNDFLKDLIRNQLVENFTTVVANSQTKGRGQMGTQWQSEDGKNLIMSSLVKEVPFSVDDIFVLNCLVSVAIVRALNEFEVPKLSIKWPNDIMSDTKKIAGVLIENLIKPDSTFVSVVGIGLNVNQKHFIELPNASSMVIQAGKQFDLDDVLEIVLSQLNYYYNVVKEGKVDQLWDLYHQHLFKKKVPAVFEDARGKRFMGIINQVNRQGKLEVQLEDDSIQQYTIKEIKMIY
ncbi:biotin--[acetyl-CoA-carboxylase] ligase [Flavobacterium sp.]|uniref:biotin--[acetyl-CoA-carboxylase] ligase n=1 Tax=Flavobacterium sp. TaxID=239 RepID=UPI002B4B4E9F|nr:biotin--[acetyl-CoA-carboxylase] ligase [Flavobacterium sp.]HLP63922.1 biotin--[acetyl-CoA-carboxylase] ligase [Flavobacterium sp.]